MTRRWSAALLLGAMLGSCGGQSLDRDDEPRSCATDADCSGKQRCELGLDRPARGMDPCGVFGRCASDRDCASGKLCVPRWQVLPDLDYCSSDLCSTPCSESGCPSGSVCGDDGICALIPCDSPGGDACPEHWTCDPGAALTASREPATGSMLGDSDVERHTNRGCVRLTCAEPDGYLCHDFWRCAPDETANPSGCVAESCAETKRCPNDEIQICGTESRHSEFTPDEHGCVTRACDEGYSCSMPTEAGVDVGVCDFSVPNHDYYGCSLLSCTRDEECFNDYVCDHRSVQRDERGCRIKSCTEGYPCPEGFLCAPGASVHDAADCTTPEFAGSGGSGGGSGSAGTGTPGAGAMTEKPGHCVP